MYEELITALRTCVDKEKGCDECPYYGKCMTTVGKHAAMMDAADAIEELQAGEKKFLRNISTLETENENLKRARRWIPVTEKLPEEEESVFVVRKFLGVKGQVPPSTYTEIAYRCGDRWIADSDEYKIARHRHTDPLYWMPLPTPPKEET